MTNICVFGSSIAFGRWDTEFSGWVNRLRIFIEPDRKTKNKVFNLGVSGDTTERLLKRFEVEIKARGPNVVMIGIGLNDSSFRISNNGPQVNQNDFKKNLEKLLQIARKYVDDIIFVGLTRVDEKKTNPIPWNADACYKNEDARKYDDIIKKFCQKTSIALY